MTKSLSCLPRAGAEPREVILTGEPLNLEEALEFVSGPGQGAVVSFSGRVRSTENSEAIRAITYEAYLEMAEKEIRRIIEKARSSWGVRLAVRHRVGEVPAGEDALLVACSHPHRAQAFQACQFVIDQIKNKVPIWKTSFER